MSHKNFKYLPYLLKKTGISPHQENLFAAIQKILEEDIPSFLRKTRAQQNKISSNYYIYFMKYRHLMKMKNKGNNYAPTYSPLRREKLQPEFQKHLALIEEISEQIFGK